MIWSTVKGAFMIQSSEICVASVLIFPPKHILLAKEMCPPNPKAIALLENSKISIISYLNPAKQDSRTEL